MLLCRDVVSQYQIQFKLIPALSCNGRDGVVGLSFGLGKDKGRLIRIAAPRQKDFSRQLAELRLVPDGIAVLTFFHDRAV